MASSYKARPLSRNDLARMARELRRILGIENQLYVNVLAILEHVLPKLDPHFTFEVVPDWQLQEMAKTYPEQHRMEIKESVYYGARNGQGRDRFTIMHEIAHYILHGKESVSFARGIEKIKTYEDPEWQADAFAGEFLVPAYLVKGMSPHQISDACGVSLNAARCQYNSNKKR